MSERITIAFRPLIRWLGASIPAIVALPNLLGIAYFLTHPSEMAADPLAPLIATFFGGLGGWALWRWVMLGGRIDAQRIVLRGLLRTVSMPRTRLTVVQKVAYRTANHDRGMRYRWVLYDAQGNLIGRIPSSLEACRGFPDFLAELKRIASANMLATAATPREV